MQDAPQLLTQKLWVTTYKQQIIPAAGQHQPAAFNADLNPDQIQVSGPDCSPSAPTNTPQAPVN